VHSNQTLQLRVGATSFDAAVNFNNEYLMYFEGNEYSKRPVLTPTFRKAFLSESNIIAGAKPQIFPY
jgi:hypothetical protein